MCDYSECETQNVGSGFKQDSRDILLRLAEPNVVQAITLVNRTMEGEHIHTLIETMSALQGADGPS